MSVLKTNLRAVRIFTKLRPKYLPFMIVNKFLTQAFTCFGIYMSAMLLDEISGARNPRTLTALVCVSVGGEFAIALVRTLFRRLSSYETGMLNQELRRQLDEVTLGFDYRYFEDVQTRDMRRKITTDAYIDDNGTERLISTLEALINIPIQMAFSIALTLGMFITVFKSGSLLTSALLTLAMLLSGAAYVLLSFRTAKERSDFDNAISDEMLNSNRVGNALASGVSGMDVRLYRQADCINRIDLEQMEREREAFAKSALFRFRCDCLLLPARYVMRGLVYVLVCVNALRGLFGLGSLFKYVAYIDRLLDCLVALPGVFGDLKYNTRFIENWLRYLDIKNVMHEGRLPTEKRSDGQYAIEFRNVSFKYPGAEDCALKNLSLTLSAGERLAVVGRNGSGKTTFIKLLCRLYDPDEGEILLNGIDIKKYDYGEYLALFSVVFQDFKLFSFKAGENVAAAESYDEARVRECMDKAGLDNSSITPETYIDKSFDKSGVIVSGGERQKLALARAMYKKAPFIILDEPTAALDPLAEAEVYSHFDAIANACTAIYISHRLSSCRFCGDIVVFEGGRLVERGGHDELLAKNGRYAELWNAQAVYYK